MLAYITGSVDQELLLQNEYLVTENRILKSQIKGRLRLTDPERISVAEIGQRLGRKALEEVAQIVRPETHSHEVRRIQEPIFGGACPNGPSNRGFGAPVCPGESQLGVSADRGRFEQPWTRNQPPDGG